jgi:hypothetical protein
VGVNRAAASKNVAGGSFSNRVVKGTIGRGRGQNLGPVDVIISALETTLEGRGMLNDCTYLE